ncbi:signal transduction histidine kinase [Hydrogenophaga palleronii]|uniref:Signal transduction histidine kinase n=1 Tax=Hydrogenophaga palleronii TaxID=65655 RepID=A0ABU1WSV3_9BURK|nr:ATP-binding protein [Hydrogenophaga palleronii]MDR7152264.1 signal transduction histidine kinase [Hydrogenophaga palleronii]
MIKSSIERVVRTRYVMPVVVALAVITVAVNESTYQHSHATLERGISLTDAHLKAANTLQALTDAETAARAYLLNGNATDLDAYRNSLAELDEVQRGAFQLIASVDPQRIVSVEAVRTRIADRVAEMNEWVAAVGEGQRVRARTLASSDRGRADLAELRQDFDAVLERAEAVQNTARASLFDAILLNRLALHLAVVVSLVALGLFLRQLREIDEQKARESEYLAHQIALRTAELRELAGYLVNTREDERSRLARELHDEMGGLLTAMKLELARLRRVPDVPAVALERASGIEQRLNESIAVKRRIVENLRPSSLDQLGLVAALEVLCEDAATSLNIPVDHTLSAVSLDKESELTVYRLVQESLTNISKYARARHVWVTLEQRDNRAVVTVRDDGKGFEVNDVGAGHHGLTGMRVRVEAHAGRLTIASSPGQGTRISAELPLRTKPAAPQHTTPVTA